MYIQVALLNGFHKTLTYKVPHGWDQRSLIGSLVEVPLQKRTERALVIDIMHEVPSSTYVIREALSQEKIPLDPSYRPWVQQLCAYYVIKPQAIYKRLSTFLEAKKIDDSAVTPISGDYKHITLTEEQHVIVNALTAQLDAPTYRPNLIHGVTGSGKTEIYKQAIAYAYAQGKTVLFLVPEVSLALQFTQLFKLYFGEQMPIYGFHSAITPAQKRELWQILLTGMPVIIVGVHLPLLLPLPNLGLIIIDEEHDAGFQEKRHPRINTKEAALLRAKIAQIPIVLGSATPAMSTYVLAQNTGWRIFTLHNRFAGAFPALHVVKLTKEPRSSFWISKELESALTTTMQNKEQAIVFLNRRGYSFFVQCSECLFIFHCSTCSVSLTLHTNNILICHYCGQNRSVPAQCPSCKKPEKNFIKKGIGTQQVVSVLEKLFPHARIGRADLDVSSNKKKWQRTLEQFSNHELDILVGTQTITKGYHFPKVTCVGILWADINLHFPFYTAAETTLQQLIQVAGRAGRQSEKSTVIIQTMLEHPLYTFIDEKNYQNFYTYELANRAATQYPPHVRFAEIELRHANEQQVCRDAHACATFLQNVIDRYKLPVIILGPAQPPVHTIKNMSSYKIYLKGPQYSQFAQLYTLAQKQNYTSIVWYTPNPLQ